MSHSQAVSTNIEEDETLNTEDNIEGQNKDHPPQTDLQISPNSTDEKVKKHEKKDKKHKEKGKKTVFRHVVRSNTLQFSNFQDFQQSIQNPNSPEKNSDNETSSTISSDSSLVPDSSHDSIPPPSSRPPPPPPKKPPSSSNPPPPPSKKPPSSSNPPPPPPSKKPPSSSNPPPPPSSKKPPPPPTSKKPPPSSKPPPPPPKQNPSPNSPPSSSNPPPPPKKPPPSSRPPPPPKPESNISLSESNINNKADDQTLQLMRKGRQKSKTISGSDIYKHRRYVPLDTPKDTSNIEDVLESSTSNTFLIQTSNDQLKEPLSEQQIIQSYFLKKNEGKDDNKDEIPIDDNNFGSNIKKSRRIRFDRNSSYSNSVFSNIIDSNELQKLASQSLKEYNDSLNQEKQDSNESNDSLLKETHIDDGNIIKESDSTSSTSKLLPASSIPENLEKLAEMNKKAKKILIKRFKKMLENYISEVEINSDFIEIDTSRDSSIHWRKDPHLIKTNELRVESRELENKIASIRFENKDLQKNITDLYQTIGSKNQELMMLQNEISRLKGISDS